MRQRSWETQPLVMQVFSLVGRVCASEGRGGLVARGLRRGAHGLAMSRCVDCDK